MSLIASDIKARFPEFASLDSATITRWLDEAERSHNSCQWGGKSDDGLAYLTAHFLSTFGSGCATGAPGPLTSKTEGQVSADWETPELFLKNDLGTTPYGRRYLSLLNSLFVCRCT